MRVNLSPFLSVQLPSPLSDGTIAVAHQPPLSTSITVIPTSQHHSHHRQRLPARQTSDQSSRNTVVYLYLPLLINLQWFCFINRIKLNISGGHSQALYCPMMRAGPEVSSEGNVGLGSGWVCSSVRRVWVLYSNIHPARVPQLSDPCQPSPHASRWVTIRA